MSQFDANMAIARDAVLMPLFGQAITYTPKVGAAVSITRAIVGAERIELEEIEEGTRRARVRDLIISTDPTCDGGGVAAPSDRATVTVGATVYAVEDGSVTIGGAVSTMKLKRSATSERARSGYRHR